MNLKNKNKSLIFSEPKLRYRMYKSKKRWMYAALSTVSVLGGGAVAGVAVATQTESVSANTSGATIPAAKALATTAGSTINKVATDPDINRGDFETGLNTTPSSPTSVTVATPDQVLNDATYKSTAITNGTYANVTTYAQLQSAWANANITYIDITANVTYPTSGGTAMTNRANGASVIVQGNNNTVDLGTQSFDWANITTSTTFTLSNMVAQQGFAANDGNGYSLISPSGATQLTANVNNLTLTKSTSNGNNPIHLMYGVGSKLVFSGTNTFNISNEVTRSVGSINFANNSSVVLNRTSNDIRFSEFYFETVASSSSVGYGNTITMGDGSSNTANTYNGQSANYPAAYLYFNGITAGDNVQWSQTGFQYFINGQQGAAATAKYTFGQNFNLSIPKSTQPGAIRVQGTQSVLFNAATTLDINQWANGAVIQTNSAGSSVTFISPKSLHMAVDTATGTPSTGPLVSGAGKFTMNNSSINTWQGTNASPATPDATGTFGNLTVQNGTTSVTGGTATSSIINTSTRELQTNALPVGDIKINYVNQNGDTVGTTSVPLSDDSNYIGQNISLVNTTYAVDNMPSGYMWALGGSTDNQIYSGAPTGTNGQPGGDPTSSIDNGDQYGQANYANVPMTGETYTYNIYVYGQSNPNISYTYVDAQTGLAVATDSGNVGSEMAGTTNVPANVGNTIDWSSNLYTQTNVPTGYVYIQPGSDMLPTNTNQPTTTVVADTTSTTNVSIYVYSPEGSTSMSTSTSISTSSSISESISLSGSISISDSLNSNTTSESTSQSISTSISTSSSLSDSIIDSDSMSSSISDSSSLSDSISASTSISDSDSMSESISDSGSLSNSISDSDSMSNSISDSSSLSISISDSDSMSESISDSGSLSNSISDSDSMSNSISDSSSLSISISDS
ncbi:KxYKxGKxW signal peptide domain-containing protein, partial [Lactococcus lactis]